MDQNPAQGNSSVNPPLDQPPTPPDANSTISSPWTTPKPVDANSQIPPNQPLDSAVLDQPSNTPATQQINIPSSTPIPDSTTTTATVSSMDTSSSLPVDPSASVQSITSPDSSISELPEAPTEVPSTGTLPVNTDVPTYSANQNTSTDDFPPGIGNNWQNSSFAQPPSSWENATDSTQVSPQVPPPAPNEVPIPQMPAQSSEAPVIEPQPQTINTTPVSADVGAPTQAASLDLSNIPLPEANQNSMEAAPTDLSNLAAALGAPTDINGTPVNGGQPSNTISQPTNTTPQSPPSAPSTVVTSSSGGLPKWAIIAGAVALLVIVTAASAYFILGIGQTQPEEEITVDQTLTNPPRAVAPTVVVTPTPEPIAPPAAEVTPLPTGTTSVFERRSQQAQ